MNLDKWIAASADPAVAANRLEKMREDESLRHIIDSLPENTAATLIHLISLSNFLYHFLCRHPDAINSIGASASIKPDKHNVASLRLFKYYELLKITCLDISFSCEYQHILEQLSHLADYTIREMFRLLEKEEHPDFINNELGVFSMGKLGAQELNYSSDIDLIFVCSNVEDTTHDIYELQSLAHDAIRQFSRFMEEKTEEGFLYRVDLKLRPWGKSGPLFMSVDETENYYEASSDPWERFAWLRGRYVAGSRKIADDFKKRLHPFIYKRFLSTNDLKQFVAIKNEMSRVRQRQGQWDVKAGEGGIRDIEFFVQVLQIVNASKHETLQTTNTLSALSALQQTGFVGEREEQEIKQAYLFFRRLENRLQMIDERQIHALPENEHQRLTLARSLYPDAQSNDEVMDNFETELFACQTIAKSYFERILPEENVA